MKILVIEGTERSCASAKHTLADHDVTVVDNAFDALMALDGHTRFDAVLTGLVIPYGRLGQMSSGESSLSQVGANTGFVFAIRAANMGIRVVICADSERYPEAACLLFDLLMNKSCPDGERPQKIAFIELGTVPMPATWDERRKKIVMDDEYWTKDGSRMKDWREAMVKSGLFPEIRSAHAPKLQSV